MFIFSILTVLLVTLCPVQAQFVVESFEYPVGSALSGLNGAFYGWSGPWVCSNVNNVIVAGLDVPGLNNEAGNCFNSTTVTVYRPYTYDFTAVTEVWYMFILHMPDTTKDVSGQRVQVESSTSSNGYGVHFNYFGGDNPVYEMYNRITNTSYAGTQTLVATAEPLLVVGRAVKTADKKVITNSLWFNPTDLSSVAALGTPNLQDTKTATSAQALYKGVMSRGSNAAYNVLVDEYRVGTNLQEIISLGLPYQPSPANGKIDVPLSQTQFTWLTPATLYPTEPNFYADPNYPGVTYDVYMGTATPNPSQPHYGLPLAGSGTGTVGGTTSFTRTGGDLTDLTNYYWCVVLNGDGSSTETIQGPAWSFRASSNLLPIVAPSNVYTWINPTTAAVTLNGNASDPDSQPTALTYLWEQTSGSPVVINTGNNTQINPAVTLPLGDYTFKVTVNDGRDSVSGSFKVVVKSTPCAAAQAQPGYTKDSGDANGDCVVDMVDLGLLASGWLECTYVGCL
jgi:hypothetical protein